MYIAYVYVYIYIYIYIYNGFLQNLFWCYIFPFCVSHGSKFQRADYVKCVSHFCTGNSSQLSLFHIIKSFYHFGTQTEMFRVGPSLIFLSLP
jgi:hypothetical protein